MTNYNERISTFLVLNTLPLILKLKKPFIRVDKKRKTLQQSLSIDEIVSLSIKNNFTGNEPNSNVARKIIESKKKVEYYLQSTTFDEFETTTNEYFFNQLKKIEKKGIISVELKKDEDGIEIPMVKKKQIIEKLGVMGIVTTIVNIANKNYWKYVRKEETLGVYIIRICR
ncbi:hypothetical protein [Terrisporobacter petrolearius]|uniref:hypothetical protein n=1 Tax=Terrisporobacter petrolearius TaxID=1460447 RepID=UPI003B004C2A